MKSYRVKLKIEFRTATFATVAMSYYQNDNYNHNELNRLALTG